MKISFLLPPLMIAFLFPLVASAQTSPTQTTCTQNEIWYSSSPVIEGQQIRIYGVVKNHTGYDLTGVAQFFADDTPLAATNFFVISDWCIQVWSDWSPTGGQQEISLRMSNIQRSTIGGALQDLDLSINPVIETVFVDLDNDGDGISNQQDPDDDNDSINDDQEPRHGTDPFNPDTDRDGIKDGDEIQQGTDPLEADQPIELIAIDLPSLSAQEESNSPQLPASTSSVPDDNEEETQSFIQKSISAVKSLFKEEVSNEDLDEHISPEETEATTKETSQRDTAEEEPLETTTPEDASKTSPFDKEQASLESTPPSSRPFLIGLTSLGMAFIAGAGLMFTLSKKD